MTQQRRLTSLHSQTIHSDILLFEIWNLTFSFLPYQGISIEAFFSTCVSLSGGSIRLKRAFVGYQQCWDRCWEERERRRPTFDTSASKVLFKRDLRIALLHLCIFIVHCVPKSHLRTRKVIRNVALKSNYVIKSNQMYLII